MILIDDVEIKTILDGMNWSGAKDIVTRQLSFSFLNNPLKKEIPLYKVSVGSKVEWKENDKTLFLGYVEQMPYSTDEDTITLTCQDLMSRLVRSTFIGRMRGTLNELASNICALFGIKNGINISNTHVHNIVSDGDLTYYEVLKVACDSMFERYALYMEGDTLKFAKHNVINTFKIGENIRVSQFNQSMSDLVTRVLVIDNNGKILNAVEDKENLQKYGLFQATYSYSKDCKNNLAEARKLLKGVTNEGTILCNNDNACISGKYIKIFEPVNGFEGIFEITSDNHTIGYNAEMTLEVDYVRAG